MQFNTITKVYCMQLILLIHGIKVIVQLYEYKLFVFDEVTKYYTCTLSWLISIDLWKQNSTISVNINKTVYLYKESRRKDNISEILILFS